MSIVPMLTFHIMNQRRSTIRRDQKRKHNASEEQNKRKVVKDDNK